MNEIVKSDNTYFKKVEHCPTNWVGVPNQLFISRYMPYLPDRQTLERELYKVLGKK